MENQDLDLLGQTVGNMPYKIGIIDQNGNLKNQFIANSSTNRIDIPEQLLNGSGSTGGSTGSNTGGTTGGNTGGGTSQSQVPQLPSALNLFTGSAVGNILLSGPSTNYDNVQDGLLITLSNLTSGVSDSGIQYRMDLSSAGLNGIKIPKEKLIVNTIFDISDQLSQYIGKKVQSQIYQGQIKAWTNTDFSNGFSIIGFGGTTINVLPNATLSINLTVSVKEDPQYGQSSYNALQIPVIQVNTYKN